MASIQLRTERLRLPGPFTMPYNDPRVAASHRPAALPVTRVTALLYFLTAVTALCGLLLSPLTILHTSVGGEVRAIACWSHYAHLAVRSAYVSILVALFGLSVIKRILDVRAGRRYRYGNNILFALVLLAPAACAAWLLDQLSPMLASNVILLSYLAAPSCIVWHAVESGCLKAFQAHRVSGIIFLTSTLLYTAVGWRLANVTGEHLGDEVHYIIQAGSLYEDGDIDLRNNIESQGFMEVALNDPDTRLHLHIAPNSLDGKLYSWHPPGLPFLMALVWPLGVAGRCLMFGFIGAMGNVGVYKLCRRFGAETAPALLVTASLGLSFYWSVYAARALPEMLGAVMLTWITLWATDLRSRKPASVLAMSLMMVAVPFVHERFAPLCALAVATYWGGLWWDRRLDGRRTASYAAVPAMIGMAGLAVYVAVQTMMFEKGLKVNDASWLLFSCPEGIVGILCGDRGLLSVFPAFAWLWVGLFVWPFQKCADRHFRIMLVLSFLLAWLVWGSNVFYTGGSCVPGRYLLIVVPLLAPAGAALLQRSSSLGRLWFIGLSLWSTLLLVLTLLHLPEVGRKFILPVPALSALPEFRSLLYPFPDMNAGAWSSGMTYGILFALVLAGVCLVAARRSRIGGYGVIAALPLLVLLAMKAHSLRVPEPLSSEVVARWLADQPDRRNMVVTGLAKPCRLYGFSRAYYFDAKQGRVALDMTTEDLGAARVNEWVSLPRIPTNDWQDRGWHWATLTKPSPTIVGPQAVHIGGRVTSGDVRPIVAVREGGVTHVEQAVSPAADGAWSADMLIDADGKSDLYVLLTLPEGTGTVAVTRLWWTPVIPRAMEAGLFTFK